MPCSDGISAATARTRSGCKEICGLHESVGDNDLHKAPFRDVQHQSAHEHSNECRKAASEDCPVRGLSTGTRSVLSIFMIFIFNNLSCIYVTAKTDYLRDDFTDQSGITRVSGVVGGRNKIHSTSQNLRPRPKFKKKSTNYDQLFFFLLDPFEIENLTL